MSNQSKKQPLRISGPELIQINSIIKTARSAVSKPRLFCWAASAANFWKRDISNTSEIAFKGPGAFGDFLCPSNTCPFKQSNLSAWSLLSWCLHIYTFKGGSVLFKLFAPRCPGRSDSNHVNRRASLKRFSWIILTTSEWVDRIRNHKSNASQNDWGEAFLAKTCAAGQIV